MQSIRENFQKHVAEKRLTGATCAVSIKGQVIYQDTFGYSDCDQRVPLQSDAIFRLASMTKPITAVAVMICRERGLLHLDAPIDSYIEGFSHDGVGEIKDGKPIFVKAARAITLRDILTHSSGLGSGQVGVYQLNQMQQPKVLAHNVMAWNHRLLDFAPGSTTAYSGRVAFELAALAVEHVSGKPFAQFLQDEIFTRLSMKDTCYSLTQEQVARLVDMPLPDNRGSIEKVDMGLRGFDPYAQGYTGGSAGLFSTRDDYVAFAQMLANGGEYNSERILSEESVMEMGRPHVASWGLSMWVRHAPSASQPLRTGSFGWSGAYGTHFWVEPQSGIAAVLMLNHANCGGSGSPFSAEFERLVETELSARDQ